MRLLQLTDLHLFAEPTGRLKGIPTRETLTDVLAHVDAHEPPVDQFVITGDLTHDERMETYQTVRTLLGDKASRCRILPGNHDDRDLMRQVFPDAAGESGMLTFSIPADNWRLIGLDTHWPGEVAGRLIAAQIEWLERELHSHADAPTGLFMHHPPVPVGVPWMDRIGLEQPQAFCRLIEASPQVQFIACGHVHHEFTLQLGTAEIVTTPSTGVQFVAAGDEPDYEPAPPGYRLFEFDGDEWRTHVVRLPEVKYVPVRDPTSSATRRSS